MSLYTGGFPTQPITAIAYDVNNNPSTTAYLGLVNSFGNPVGTGKSVYSPSSGMASPGQTVVAVDRDPGSPNYQDSYTAWSYEPAGSNHYEFAVTRWSGSGAIDQSWGTGGTLSFSFDSGNDTPTSIVVSSGGSYVVVAGKCATGWAMAIIDSYTEQFDNSYGVVDRKTPANFQSGEVNGLAYDQTDNEVVAAGNDGNGKMAASLFNVDYNFSTGGYDFSYIWSPSVKTYSTGGVSDSASSAVIDIGGDGQNENQAEGAVVLGGTTWYSDNSCCQTGYGSDFTMVALHENDGSVISTFGNNGVIVSPNISYTLTSCPHVYSNDSETSLMTWVGPDGNYYLTEGGQNSNPYGQFALIRYKCSFDVSNTLNGASLYTSFGPYSDGITIDEVGYVAAAVQNAADGTIYMTGSDANDEDVVVVAFDSTGNLKSTFGDGGYIQTDLGSSTAASTDNGWGIDFAADGTIIVSAQSSLSNWRIALVDYLPSNDLP